MNRNRIGCLTVALIVVLGVSLLCNLLLLAGRSSTVVTSPARPLPRFDEAIVKPAASGAEGKVALIYLRGLITSADPGTAGETMVDDLKLQLLQAAGDAKVKSIVLYVESPGGEVTASDSIYRAVRRVRDEVGKPVVVYMGSVAASGGYYIACGGSHLMANETTFTGSIGVIMQTLNYEQLLGKVGLQMLTFKSGKFKDLLSGSRAPTEEEKAYVQSLVDETYGRFLGIVATERKLDAGALREGLADGRIVSGKMALEGRLIDSVGEVENAYDKAMELGKAPGAAVVRYELPFKLSRLLGALSQSGGTGKVEVRVADGLVPRLEAGKMYFLPSHYAP